MRLLESKQRSQDLRLAHVKKLRVFRNMYKGHMDKTKGGYVGSRVGSGDGWGVGE